MKNDKAENRERLRERARAAIRDLYHNATLPMIRDLYGRSEDYADEWLRAACEFEIEYLRDGGAHGANYRKTLEHPANAGKYKSAAAQAYYVRKGMRDYRLELEDCGMLTGWRVLECAVMRAGGRVGGPQRARLLSLFKTYPGIQRNDAQWERISEYGKLYQWGRGGRTLAPADLVRMGGGSSFSLRESYADELPYSDLADFCRVLESFNSYVSSWCASVPDQWRDHCAEEDAETLRQKRKAAARKAKETRERNYWAARDVVTV